MEDGLDVYCMSMEAEAEETVKTASLLVLAWMIRCTTYRSARSSPMK